MKKFYHSKSSQSFLLRKVKERLTKNVRHFKKNPVYPSIICQYCGSVISYSAEKKLKFEFALCEECLDTEIKRRKLEKQLDLWYN